MPNLMSTMATTLPLSSDADLDPQYRPRLLTPQRAISRAWILWGVGLLIPMVFSFVVVLAVLSGVGNDSDRTASVWFVISGIWLGLSVPLAFWLRSYCFKSYWQGRVVEPRSYIKGMVWIWGSLVLGALLALLGVLLSGQLMPGLLVAGLALMLYLPFWPSGRAMTLPVGGEDDDQVFLHPR